MTEESTTRTGAHTALILTLLMVTSLTIMAGATIAPSLPGIRDHFASVPAVEILARLLLTIPALAIAVFAPAVGWVIDRFGRRRILLGSIVIFAIAGTAGLYLDSLTALVVSRALLGVSVAGTLTCATTLIGDNFTGGERNRVLGLQGAFVAFSGVIFLLVGGVAAEIGWRAPFALYALALGVLPAAIVFVPEPRRETGPAPEGHAHTGMRVAALIVAIYAVSFMVQIAFYMVPVQLPFYLAEMGVSDPSRAGVALATMTLSAALVASRFRWIQSKLDRTVILSLSLGLIGIGFLLVSRAGSYAAVVLAMVVAGSGAGLNFPNLSGWLLARTPEAIRGRVIGGLSTFIFLGQFFSPIVSYPFIERGGIAHGYRVLGGFMDVLCLAAILSSIAKVLQARRAA